MGQKHMRSMLSFPFFRKIGRGTRRNAGLLWLLVWMLAGHQMVGQVPPQEPLPAADTRKDLLRSVRQAAQKDIVYTPPSTLEKAFLFVEDQNFVDIINLGIDNFYPRFGSITEGSGFALGARYFPEGLGKRWLDLQAMGAFSFSGYRQYGFQFGSLPDGGTQAFASPLDNKGLFYDPFDPERRDARAFFLYADLRYDYFPQIDFYGLGNDSREIDQTNFLVEKSFYDGVAAGHLNNFLGLGLRAGYLKVSVRRGTDSVLPDTQSAFTDQQAPGLSRQPDFFHATTSAWLDYRDRPGHPHLGGLLVASLSRFSDIDSTGFAFNRFRFDSRHFLPLGSNQRVLAFRFLTSLDTPDGGSRVPFYLQETLGGSNRLRGYNNYRFRGPNLIYFSTEYRWEPAAAWELALFYDTGKVFFDRSNFELDHLKKSIGFGIRFKSPQFVFLRLDIGRSEEGTTFHFSFGPSF